MTMSRIYGLTGGIASGKSTVGAMFVKQGIPLIDADLIARDIVKQGSTALKHMVETFGDHVLTADGQLDRKSMGDLVFTDKSARDKLNAITHPKIIMECQRQITQLQHHPAILYEAALIIENNMTHWLTAIIVVATPRHIQKERLMNRNTLTAQEADNRLDSQLPLKDKIERADYVIDNSKSLQNTEQQVLEIIKTITHQERSC